MPTSRRPARLRPAGLLALALGAIACGNGKDAGKVAGRGAGDPATTRTIGVTLLTREHEFYRQLVQGLEDEAAKKGYRLVVTSGDFDLAKQQSQIDNFLVQKVDAIIVCPVDSKGIGPAIDKANRANVPVFTADISASSGRVVSHVASDNVEGGRLAGEYIAKALGGKGEVGIIGQPEVQSTIDREAGYREAIAKHPGLTLVASISGSGVRDRALKAADDMLQAHPNIAGIFAINDETALGALSSARSRRNTRVVIVGYDAVPEATKAIAAGGNLRADVAQQPRDIGVRTIDAIAEHFAGRTPPARVTVPVAIVDAASLKSGGAPAPTAGAAAP